MQKNIVLLTLLVMESASFFYDLVDKRLRAYKLQTQTDKTSERTADINEKTAICGDDSLDDSLADALPQHDTNPRLTETAVICSIMINEEAYITEWIDYHLGLGFSHLYIYDNSPEYDLMDFAHPNVTIVHYPGKGRQMEAYLDCALRAEKEKHTWAAFFDCDEFLRLLHHDHIVPFLQVYCARGAIAINWFIMTSSGERTYRPRPVTSRFVAGEGSPDGFVKPIARLQDMMKKPSGGPHNVRIRDFEKKIGTGMDYHDTMLLPVNGHFNKRKPRDVALLYHYNTKSWKELIGKRMRGRASPQNALNDKVISRDINDAISGKGMSNEGKFDDSVWRALKHMHPKYAIYDRNLSTTSVSNVLPSSFAICSVLDDDEAYVDEFFDYHQAIGVDHFYFFVHDAFNLKELSDWARERGSGVTMKHFGNKDDLLASFQNCTTDHTGFSWITALASNEFLVLPEDITLGDWLRDKETERCLHIPKFIFGTNNSRLYQPLPVLKRFRHRGENPDGTVTLQKFDKSTGKEMLNCSLQSTARVHVYQRSLKECWQKFATDDRNNGKIDCSFVGDQYDDTAWVKMKKVLPEYAAFDAF